MSRVEQFCERFLEASWLIALAIVPLYFDIYSSRVFEPDKTIFFRCLVVLMLVAQAVQSIHGRAELPTSLTHFQSSDVWRSARSNPLLRPVLAVVAIETLATITSIVPWTSLYGSYQRMQGTITLLAYVAFFLIIACHLQTPAQFRRVLTVAVATSFPIALYGIAQHLQLDPLPWGGDVTFRVTSTMGNAIFLAAYLILIVPLTGGRLVEALSQSRDGSLPDSSPITSWVTRWVLAIAIQLAGFAIPLALHQSAPTIWWLVPVVVSVTTLIIAGQSPPAPSRRTSRIRVGVFGALLLIQVTCVVLTQSRGPWLGLIAAAVIFIVLLEIAGRVSRTMVLGTIAIMSVLGLTLFVFNLPSSPLASFRSLPYVGRLGQLTEVSDGTGRVRVLIWQGTRVLLTEHPSIGFSADPLSILRPVIGYGPEAMRLAYNVVYPPELGDLESRNASPDRNHNDLLDHLVSTGLLGLLAYLFLVMSAMVLALRTVRRTTIFSQAAIVVALVSTLVAHLAETQTGIAIVSTKVYFWTVLALMVVASVRPAVLSSASPGIAASEQAVDVAAPGARARRPAKRAPAAIGSSSTPRQREPMSRPTRRRLLVWSWFAAIVVSTHTVATLATGAGSIAVQNWVYLSFGWVALAAAAHGLAGSPLRVSPGLRARDVASIAVGLLVAVVLLGFDLDHVAADVYHKEGTGFDLQQRYSDSARSYLQAYASAPDQDYYALFLGRAFLDLAMHSSDQAATVANPLTLDQLGKLDAASLAKLSRVDALSASETALLRAKDLAPLDPDHLANLARLEQYWGQLGDPSKLAQAANYASLASQLSPHSAELLDEWAVVLMQEGNLVDAEAKGRLSVRLDPAYAASHAVLGDILLERHDPADALSEHGKALALDPGALSDATFDRRISL
ncbi:MAG TPA: O-antigen ligase family protein, partial [Chloroflexota bacterium]|nr:O-antigen ligase family protein [Chloroflexota bacterium]